MYRTSLLPMLLMLSLNSYGEEAVFRGAIRCCEKLTIGQARRAADSSLKTLRQPFVWATLASSAPQKGGFASGVHHSKTTCHNYVDFLLDTHHAFLVRTPIGASLYLFGVRPRSIQSIRLRGADPLNILDGAMRIADINAVSGSHRALTMKIVVSRNVSLESRLVAVYDYLAKVDIDSAHIQFRSDPWYWPGGCMFVSPLYWEAASRESVSIVTEICEVDVRERRSSCTTIKD